MLAEAGAKPEHITTMTWYFTDKQEYLANLKGVGQAYREVIGKHFPAMAAVRGDGAGRGPRQGRDPGDGGGAGLTLRVISIEARRLRRNHRFRFDLDLVVADEVAGLDHRVRRHDARRTRGRGRATTGSHFAASFR